MKNNVGTLDRALRISAGAILITLAATDKVGAWGWLGLFPIASGVLGWCPPYTLLGINTCKKPN